MVGGSAIVTTRHKISEFIYGRPITIPPGPHSDEEPETQTQNKYPCLFGAATFHIQDPGTLRIPSQFLPHVDKTGMIVALYQLSGVSYNFFAVQKNDKNQNLCTMCIAM